MWGRKAVHRGETMIALRARREAVLVARDVAYPQLPGPPPLAEPVTFLPPAQSVVPEWWDDGDVDYASKWTLMPLRAVDESGEAPAWMKWLMPACFGAIAVGSFLLIRLLC
jgi:hypothetical protein